MLCFILAKPGRCYYNGRPVDSATLYGNYTGVKQREMTQNH